MEHLGNSRVVCRQLHQSPVETRPMRQGGHRSFHETKPCRAMELQTTRLSQLGVVPLDQNPVFLSERPGEDNSRGRMPQMERIPVSVRILIDVVFHVFLLACSLINSSRSMRPILVTRVVLNRFGAAE